MRKKQTKSSGIKTAPLFLAPRRQREASSAAAGAAAAAAAFFCAFSSGAVAQGAEGLASSPEALKVMQSGSFGPPLRAVQKRLLPKKWLSEVSLGASPALTGLTYINSASADFGYRLHLSSHWSVHAKYSHFFNKRSAEGNELPLSRAEIPAEMKYPQKWAALAGIDFAPFYGKTILFSHVVRFDLYLSLSGGVLARLRAAEKTAAGSLAAGAVFWLSRRFSARAELGGLAGSYKYRDSRGEQRERQAYVTKMSLSGGILF